jgi:hypothetical protein
MRGFHPFGGTAEDQILPHGGVESGREQIVMPPDSIGTQMFFSHQDSIIVLKVFRTQILNRNTAQGGGEMVVDDLSVAIGGGFRPVGDDDLLHPSLQPFIQCHADRLDELPLGLFQKELVSGSSGGGEGGIGAVPPDPPAVLVLSQIHVKVVHMSLVIIGNVSFILGPAHILFLLSFVTGFESKAYHVEEKRDRKISSNP